MALGETVNQLADTFPRKEIYNLSSQVRRAADSVALNIAEGSTGHTDAEQKRFLIFANRSVLEVVTRLVKAKLRNYVTEEKYIELYNECEKLCKSIQAFIARLS